MADPSLPSPKPPPSGEQPECLETGQPRGPVIQDGSGFPPPDLYASGGPERARRARLAAILEVVACSGFPTQLFIAQLLMALGLRPTTNRGLSATFIFTLSIADAAAVVGLVLWFLRVHGESPVRVLLGSRRLWRELALGVVLIPLVFVLATALLSFVGWLVPGAHNVVRNPLEALIRTPSDAIAFAFVAVLSGGVREEVQRAFILHRFEQHLGGAALGVVLFSLVFGSGHLIQGWDAALTTAVLGAFWGVVYLARRSMLAPMVSHAGFDVVEIVQYSLLH